MNNSPKLTTAMNSVRQMIMNQEMKVMELSEEEKVNYEEEMEKEKEREKLLYDFLFQELNPEVKVYLESQVTVKGYHYIHGYTEFMNDSNGFLLKITDEGKLVDFIDYPKWMSEKQWIVLKDAITEHIENRGLRLMTSPLRQADQWQKQQLLQTVFQYHYEKGNLDQIMEASE
jgi:hypothetical protein